MQVENNRTNDSLPETNINIYTAYYEFQQCKSLKAHTIY
jgi:hypothetical protein